MWLAGFNESYIASITFLRTILFCGMRQGSMDEKITNQKFLVAITTPTKMSSSGPCLKIQKALQSTRVKKIVRIKVLIDLLQKLDVDGWKVAQADDIGLLPR